MSATSLSVFVPALPQRVLSSNAGARSRRDPWSVANGIAELKDETMQALLNLGLAGVPHFDRARVTVTLRCTSKRPKLEACPRCFTRAVGGDHPRWADPLRCCCYRVEDVGNIGGQTLKPILDAFTVLGVWDDDDWKHVPEVTLRIERVETIEEEGICVEVTAA